MFSRREVLNFHISGCIRRKKVLEMGKCLVFLSSDLKWNSFWHARQDEFFASELYVCYVNKDKRHIMCDNRFFWRFCDGKFWILISLVLWGVRRCLKRENVPLFKLLFEMKLFLRCQTRRVFASGLHLSHFYKGRHGTRVGLCDNLIISRQEVLNFHMSGFIRRKKAFETGKCSVV